MNSIEQKGESFLTIQELAERGVLPFARKKLYEMAKHGHFRSYRVGKKVLVLESEVISDIKKRFPMRVIHGKPA